MAIQDAVAAANVLWEPLRRAQVSVRDLQEVQRQRAWSVRVIQAMQAFVHRRLLGPALTSTGRAPAIPAAMRLLLRVPGVSAVPARLIALGVRRPHVQSPAVAQDGAGVREVGT